MTNNPVTTTVTASASGCDGVSESAVNRAARNFKAQFIEVHTGSQTFADDMDDLNVVVAIYLQATERLYEVVIVNKDTTKEISRLYVYEDELSDQMKKRHAALTLSRDENKNMVTSNTSHNSSSCNLSTLVKRKNSAISAAIALRDTRRKTLSAIPNTSISRRMSLKKLSSNVNGSKELSSKEKNRSKTFAGRRSSQFALLGTVNSNISATEIQQHLLQQRDDEILLFINHQTKKTSTSDTATSNAVPRTSKSKSKLPSIRLPMEYFQLVPGHTEDQQHDAAAPRKVEREAFLNNSSLLLESDISASAVQDIRFFTTVILTSLCVRQKATKDTEMDTELQFVLFDDASELFFYFMEQFPPSCLANTSPTVVDGAALVTRLNSAGNWKISLTADNQELVVVQNLLDSASGFHAKSHTDMHTWHRQGSESSSTLEENINPNKHPYRYMWQAAYTAVVKELRARKQMRSAWQGVIDMKKQSNAREAFLQEQRQRGKFRVLRASDDVGLTSYENITNYKSALASKVTIGVREKDVGQGKRRLSRAVLAPPGSISEKKQRLLHTSVA